MKIGPEVEGSAAQGLTPRSSKMSTGDTSLADHSRLEKIDKLTELGIGEYVALPQLVVVGDQSSGKSSVLEGLTELPFPRDSSLCTRFATRIVFRRSPQENILISIIPHASSSDERAAKLRAFQKSDVNLTAESFKEILAEACEAMGVPGPGEAPADGQPAFSEDILNIELSGPERSHLSVIDVPGIFRSPNPPLTTSSDMAMVRRMVHNFIKESRTIILAVLPANVDVATQEILELAGEVDPSGDRTLGVLTKPDLVEAGTEKDIIELVEGKRKPLKLGYCVVRNRKFDEQDATSIERHRTEKSYFDSGPFSVLGKDRVGISALHTRLQVLLRQITRNTFPSVRKEIDKRLKACSDELEALGPSRQTEEQQRKYLMNIAVDYQATVGFAVDAQYARSSYLREKDSIRLATKLVDINNSFSDMMARHGQTVNFAEDPVDGDKPHVDLKSSKASMPNGLNLSKFGNEVDGLFGCDTFEVERNSHNILDWLREEYKRSRGFELGTFNPALLPNIFRTFTKNWEPITWWYYSKIIATVHEFSHDLLEHQIHDKKVLINLWELLLDDFRAKYSTTRDNLRFLLEVERSGTLLTTNHYFAQNLQAAERKRMEEHLNKHTELDPDGTRILTEPKKFLESSRMSNDDHTVRSIHDVLNAYYKVARKRFVDCVCLHGTDYHLISGPTAVLRHFSSNYVLELTPSQLAAVAGEDIITFERRAALEKQIESLKKGRAVLMS